MTSTAIDVGASEALEEQPKNASIGTSVVPRIIKMCNLDVKDVALGRQVTFTLPKDMSKKMVLGAIEKANQRSLGCEVTSYVFPPYTSSPKVGDLETIVVAQNTNFSTTICFDSNNLTRHEQYSYLKDNGLDFTDRWILAIAAALYRFEYGFPPSVFDIGTSRDKGDLFNGYVIRDYSGTLKYENGIHYQCGLHESYYYQYGHRRHRKIIAAGSPARIAKLLFDPFCW